MYRLYRMYHLGQMYHLCHLHLMGHLGQMGQMSLKGLTTLFIQGDADKSLSLHFSYVSLKERIPSGIKQVIFKPFEHKVVAQLSS